MSHDAGESAFPQFRAAAFGDERFEPDRLQAALRTILGPLEDVRTDEQLLAVWRDGFDRWLPEHWRRTRLPGVPGGWGADVNVASLDVVTFRNAEPAEVVVRADLEVRRWPQMPGLGALVRALARADHVLWLTLVDTTGDGWTLSRVDFDGAGEFHLGAETVAVTERDPALADAASHELAHDDAVPEPGTLLRGADGDAQQQLLDLSLADGRFAPHVVEASVRSLIRAWRQMVVGHENAYEELAALATHEVATYAREAYQPVRLDAIEVAAIVQHWRLVDAYAAPELRALRQAADTG